MPYRQTQGGLNPGGTRRRGGASRARRGHNGFGRRIFQPYQCFPAPIPPTPFPAGRGRPRFFMQGASPLASPGAEPGRCWLRSATHSGKFWGGWGTLSRVPRRFFAPIPPTRTRRALFPAGRGRFLVYFAGGWRPRHPCTEPLTALTNHAIQATPRGAEPGRRGEGVQRTRPKGGHGDFGRRVCQPYQCFPAPIPPTPFPAGRGRPRLFYARGFAPCIPATEPARHWLDLPL